MSRDRDVAGRPPFRTGDGAGGGGYSAEDRREEAPASLPDAPACPFCSGDETELMNAFGSHASVSTYWCRTCRSPFELMKWRGGPTPGGSAGSDP